MFKQNRPVSVRCVWSTAFGADDFQYVWLYYAIALSCVETASGVIKLDFCSVFKTALTSPVI